MTTISQFEYIIRTAIAHYRQGNPYFLDRFKDESVSRIECTLWGPVGFDFAIHTKCGKVIELCIHANSTRDLEILGVTDASI